MKRRIWLDDIRVMPNGYDIHFTKASDCISFIEFFPDRIGHISFDHDLGNDADGTGYSVAVVIEGMAYYGDIDPITFDIHSANPIGQKNIERAMESAIKSWKIHQNKEKNHER